MKTYLIVGLMLCTGVAGAGQFYPSAPRPWDYPNLAPNPYESRYDTEPDERGNVGFNQDLYESDDDAYWREQEQDDKLNSLGY